MHLTKRWSSVAPVTKPCPGLTTIVKQPRRGKQWAPMNHDTYVIWRSLLGSYVCLITTRLTTVDIFIAKVAVQVVGTKLLLLPLRDHLHCTVQYVKYVPVTSIIGGWFQEPDWVSVTFHGAPTSM